MAMSILKIHKWVLISITAKNVLHSYRGFLLKLHLKDRQLMVICIDKSKS